MLVPAIDVGAGDPDPLGPYLIVARVVGRENRINARQEQAWRYLRLDHLIGGVAARRQ